jgi:HK97 family phage prohead protease
MSQATSIRRAPMGRQEFFVPHKPVVIGDGREHRIKAVANTGTLDRYRTRIMPAGMHIRQGPLALLFAHNTRDPVGRIERIERDDEAVTFEAIVTDERIFRMVLEGAVTGTSIGFIPNEWDLDDERDELTCRSWELAEISLVTVPANVEARITEVRSAEDHTMSDHHVSFVDRSAHLPARQPLPAAARPEVRIVRQTAAAAPAVHTARAVPFNPGRLWAHQLGDAHLDGMEREVCEELAKRAPPRSDRGGLRIPFAVFHPERLRSADPFTRALSTNPASIGALSPTQYVEQLLDDTVGGRRWGLLLPRLGFTEWTTTFESVDVPKRDSRMVASHGPKDAAGAETEWTADSDHVIPTYVKCWTTIERSALKYPRPDALALTLQDIADAIDSGADDGALFGTGANDQPTGLLRTPGGGFDLAGAPAESNDFITLKNDLIDAWHFDQGDNSMRWLMNARSWDTLRVTSKKSAAGTPLDEWPSGIAPFDAGEGALLQIPVIQSGKVTVKANPANSYDIDLIYPRMGVIVWFAGGSIDTIVDTSTLSTRSAARVSAFLDYNVSTRDPNIFYRLSNVQALPPRATTPRTPIEPPPPQPSGRNRRNAI